MMRIPGRIAALPLSILATQIAAQDRAQEIAALEARVAELERGQSTTPDLSFNLGAATELTIYGYIKADLIFDLDSDLGNTTFGLASLGDTPLTGEEFTAHAFQTRLGFRTTTDTAIGPVETQLEGDFFGDGGGGFRLRHANLTFAGILAGQYWTNFMPIESYPATLDFQGPAGIPFVRETQLRYTYEAGNGFAVSGSVEQSNADSDDPVITLAAMYQGDSYFVKLAALGGTVNGATEEVDSYGINLSGNAQLWEGGSLQAQYTHGEAIASYMVFGGADTFGDAAVESEGYTLSLTQELNDQWSGSVSYGYREDDIGAAADTHSLETLHVSATYRPAENLSVGVEYFIGERARFDGATFDAERIQTSLQLNF